MNAKILTQNGQVKYRPTYRPLVPDELIDQEGQFVQEQFMVSVHKKVGCCVLPRDLGDIGHKDIPQYDSFENDIQTNQTFSQLQEEEEISTPEVADYYLGLEILLPRWDQVARGPCGHM